MAKHWDGFLSNYTLMMIVCTLGHDDQLSALKQGLIPSGK
jgi:hypothetical protein